MAGGALLLASTLCDAKSVPARAAPANVSYAWALPRGFPDPPVPVNNPMSAAKVALGRRLFFEPRLSVNGRYSCSSCHDPARSYTDGQANAIGASGEVLSRNAMALINVAYNASYGWSTPKVLSLEAQMRQPLFNAHPVEMGLAGRERVLIQQLRKDPTYLAEFAGAFPGTKPAVSIDNMIRAIAAFERTLLFGDSPFDRYAFGGEHTAISDAAKAGMALFYSARLGCADCHGGFNFTGTWNERGRPTAPAALACNGVGVRPMRVPTLRNVALTAPYMHDGRFATLDAVITHYEHLGPPRTCPDPRLRKFSLNATERVALIAFLQSLTSPLNPNGPARR